MLEYVVNKLFTIKPLREAIFDEVHLYDQIDAALRNDDGRRTNCSWNEGGLWYGWYFNEKHKVYLFDDTGHEDLTTLWQSNWEWDLEMDMGYL